MDRQEIFNKVYLGLKSQGFQRSVNTNGVCLYRGPENRKCAAGWLIPDEYYKHEYEKIAFDYLHNLHKLMGIDEEEADFIKALQILHDGSSMAETMEQHLKYFAKANQLTVPE